MANNEINTEQLKKEVKEELLKREILMGMEEDEIDLFELLGVLKKYWKMIVFFPIVIALLVAVYSLTMPNFYKSSASIYVHSNSGSGGLASLLGGNSALLGMMGVGGGGGANYLTVFLKSVQMSDFVIKEFGIATNPAIVGDKKQDSSEPVLYDNLLKIVDGIITVDTDAKTGLITVSAETMSATTSADIVNAMISRLDSFTKGPQKEKRLFIEKQLAKITKELDVAENEFKDFQDKYKMFSLEKQAAVTIDKLAGLETQRVGSNISMEMQESLLKSSGNVTELVKVEAQKVAEEAKTEAIKKEIAEVEKELANLPEVTLEFVRLQRNLKVKEKVFGILTEQFEMAKITEAEEGSQFEVIDYVRIPDLKSKPKRAIMVILGGLSAGVLAVFAAFLIEFLKRRKNQTEKSEEKQEEEKAEA